MAKHAHTDYVERVRHYNNYNHSTENTNMAAAGMRKVVLSSLRGGS